MGSTVTSRYKRVCGENVVVWGRTRNRGLGCQTELAHARFCVLVAICCCCCCCRRLVELAIDKGTRFAARYRMQRYGRVLDLERASRRGGLIRVDTVDVQSAARIQWPRQRTYLSIM